ncbi:MAG TPA: DNA replication and repair protein RecF [Patescibacteria group bacterium]|nr:DNA replication and repair protein RecF [Patescibacteria group bacterium]
MIVKKLFLQDFRSYTHEQVHFVPSVNVFIGDNTQGKTNLLEALFVLATGTSFRADLDRDMIHFHKEFARLTGVIERKEGDKKLEVMITGGSIQETRTPYKRYLVNGVGKRAIDSIGVFQAILFSPEDLDLVTSSPSVRRKHLDFFLIQVSREYRRAVREYTKTVSQRNRLLEAISKEMANESELGFWDEALLEHGTVMQQKREAFFAFMEAKKKEYRFVYHKSILNHESLKSYRKKEIASHTTLLGPHRDDFSFSLKGLDLAKYGSRGEQRTAIVQLKLMELEFMEGQLGERPVFLLDDIFSELDHAHREELIPLIQKQQTLITATDIHLVPEELREEATMYHVSGGRITRMG